jgi:hypothetical protein
MSNSVSPSLSPSDAAACGSRRRLRTAACWAVGILWAALLFLRSLDAGPEDSVRACRRAIHRDPVTSREQGIGSARIAADGAMTCRGMTFRPAPQ